ncbi:hypothetical protein [Deinococcus peraridilitoris]|uniref:Uncharacterized protein n=1 Tax=Deinococcus peraridilitoris (strain DSM 19664 / LMG 22246 / CIP 109416 / KR-200) TaxID=937777 RepID=L0A1L2_DEIPD|nr:hypothetical protein [Deinococcus peraridilitoris]AFZ67339.1 hypothetical protein Deipe_1823 [Deinococcus peraridilitoris DSM 19664]
MRNLKVVLAALALGAATTAFAGAGPATNTVTLTNDIKDTIVVAGPVTISITELGKAFANANATLAYSTHAEDKIGVTTRKVLVKATGVPTNVTGSVAFTPTAALGDPNGVGSTQTLGAEAALVTGITQFITQDAAALTYSFTATKGFIGGDVTVTYTLADE